MSKQRVLITGGASGLGRELALRWANAGAKVCIVDINDERGAEVLQELQALGAEPIYCRCDITNDEQIAQVKQTLLEEWQGVDLVINNAGVATAGSLVDEPIAQWQWCFDINVLGAVRFSQAFVEIFKQQGSGYFLNVASQAGLTPMPVMGSYCALKAAVVSFSETLRLELVDDNIGVSVLCPGFFKTHLDESMRSNNPAMKNVVTKMLSRSNISAAQVANIAFEGIQNNKFLIQTHKDGVWAHRLRRWLPEKWYLNMMTKKTKKFREQG